MTLLCSLHTHIPHFQYVTYPFECKLIPRGDRGESRLIENVYAEKLQGKTKYLLNEKKMVTHRLLVE